MQFWELENITCAHIPGGGGCSGFQVTRMIEWSQKSRPKKIFRASSKTQINPWTKNEPPKNPMPILWPLKLPERSNAIAQRKTLKIEHSCSFIHHTIWIYMYPFPHLAVILTMLEWVLETPKNRGFCFNNSKTRLFVLYSQNYAARALPILFNTPQKIPTQIKLPKKILAKFSYPKKSQNRKFQTQKNPSIIPVSWNPEYLPWAIYTVINVTI